MTIENMVMSKSKETPDKRNKKSAMKRKRKTKISKDASVVAKSEKTCEADVKNIESTQTETDEDSKLAIKKSKSSDATKNYPILSDESFIQKIHSIPLTNNQKGRIRQILKDNLKGTSETMLPDVIHNKIQTILKSSESYTDSDLRKMRILFNMLKTALQNKVCDAEKKTGEANDKKSSKKKEKIVREKLETNVINEKENTVEKEEKQKENKEKQKKKGPKRYVVFLGNLPMDIDKEKIMQHFSDIKNFIKDVRLPKEKGGKSAIAYVELENETIYELALSKHHSMLGNRRINVLYTTQKNGKVTKTEAKSKTAKLLALQKSGKIVGSVPMNKKRSQRRLKMKQAQAKLAAESA